MEEIKKVLDAKEAFVNYIKQFEENYTTTGSDFNVDMNDEIGDTLLDYAKFIKTHEHNIEVKKKVIFLMKKFMLGLVDKISEYNDKIRVSEELIDEAKEKIIDLVED